MQRPSWTPSWISDFAHQYFTGTHLILKVYYLRYQNQSKSHIGRSLQGKANFAYLASRLSPNFIIEQLVIQDLEKKLYVSFT